MTPGRPAARPAGLYTHAPTPVRAMTWTGEPADLPALRSFFGHPMWTVDLPGLGLCIPIATPCGTVYAAPTDVLTQTPDGHLKAAPDTQFAAAYVLQEEQPA